MCNKTGMAFAERVMTASMVQGRDVVEVGAYDVNGSVRPHIESLGPASYLGLDIEEGPGVDRVLDARDLLSELGRESADVVISTEMIEHVRDWPVVVTNLKGLLRPGGHLLVTTRSAGFPYHAWPYDFWRYELDDFRRIFGDLEILALESDAASPGVFLFARRPERFVEATPALALRSIVTGRRQVEITDAEVARFRPPAPSPIPPSRSAGAGIRARLARTSRAVHRLHLARTLRRWIIGPAWMALPVAARRRIKRLFGRA